VNSVDRRRSALAAASKPLLFQQHEPLRSIPQAPPEVIGLLGDHGRLIRERLEAAAQVSHANGFDVLDVSLGALDIGHTDLLMRWPSACRIERSGVYRDTITDGLPSYDALRASGRS
jgi:hypothetical protein